MLTFMPSFDLFVYGLDVFLLHFIFLMTAKQLLSAVQLLKKNQLNRKFNSDLYTF